MNSTIKQLIWKLTLLDGCFGDADLSFRCVVRCFKNLVKVVLFLPCRSERKKLLGTVFVELMLDVIKTSNHSMRISLVRLQIMTHCYLNFWIGPTLLPQKFPFRGVWSIFDRYTKHIFPRRITFYLNFLSMSIWASLFNLFKIR